MKSFLNTVLAVIGVCGLLLACGVSITASFFCFITGNIFGSIYYGVIALGLFIYTIVVSLKKADEWDERP